ncbi:hypothetical protein GGF31_003983 [Allomyces arbusculus]|nr:hypothetical protein GGF31_003983 [Allomyces arbusculus]
MGNWTWTRDMYGFVHEHHAVVLAVLRLVAITQSLSLTLSRAMLRLKRVYAKLKQRESQPNFPAPLHDGVTRMLTKICAVWPVFMTRQVYHALYLDACTADFEGTLYLPDAVQAQWTANRDEYAFD